MENEKEDDEFRLGNLILLFLAIFGVFIPWIIGISEIIRWIF